MPWDPWREVAVECQAVDRARAPLPPGLRTWVWILGVLTSLRPALAGDGRVSGRSGEGGQAGLDHGLAREA